jgi:hypothetical protein
MRPVLTNQLESIKSMHCMKTHQLLVGQQLLIHGTDAEQPGIFHTLFKLLDFVEDTARSAVYTFCPAKKSSYLMDVYAEEQAFSNIFMESSSSENHEVKIEYPKTVKSQL